jgi:hypothetical protein
MSTNVPLTLPGNPALHANFLRRRGKFKRTLQSIDATGGDGDWKRVESLRRCSANDLSKGQGLSVKH